MPHVRLRLRMRPHPVVHRRTDEHRRTGGQEDGGQKVVRAACGRSSQEVRRGGSDADDIRFPRQADVVQGVPRRKDRPEYVAGQRLERDR